MKFKYTGSNRTVAAGIGAAVLLAIIGYIINLFQIIGFIGEDVTTELIIRAVGVFAWPIGSIMGLFVW